MYRSSLRERIWVWKLSGQNFPFKQLVKLSDWARICVMMHLVIPLVSVWVAWDGVGDLCSDHLCSDGWKDVPMSRDFWNYCGMFSFGHFCLVLLAGRIGTVYIFTELEKTEQVSGVRVCLLQEFCDGRNWNTMPGFVTSTWGSPFSSGYFIVGVERWRQGKEIHIGSS